MTEIRSGTLSKNKAIKHFKIIPSYYTASLILLGKAIKLPITVNVFL